MNVWKPPVSSCNARNFNRWSMRCSGFSMLPYSMVAFDRMPGSDVLRLSGFLVNPLEIETHIQKLPAIEGCQTIAVARPDGVRAVSFVMLKPGASLDEPAVIAHCRHGLANYKVPARVFAIEDFPKTPSPNGFKIQRAKLRQMAEDLLRRSS